MHAKMQFQSVFYLIFWEALRKEHNFDIISPLPCFPNQRQYIFFIIIYLTFVETTKNSLVTSLILKKEE